MDSEIRESARLQICFRKTHCLDATDVQSQAIRNCLIMHIQSFIRG